MVDEGWRHIAKDILEKGVHVEPDSYPSARELLELGAVWLLDEAAYAKGGSAHAKRLSPKDEMDTPTWEDMTLRVHYVPDRFHVAHEVEWTKYCKALLLDNNAAAVIGSEKAHVPMTGLPDKKDGAIVYEVRFCCKGFFFVLGVIFLYHYFCGSRYIIGVFYSSFVSFF